MTPKEAVDAMFSAFVPLKEEHLLTIDEFRERRKIVLEALDQKAKQEKEISALGKLCENQDKLIERRESELRGYREVIEGNFEINITEEATPDKLNECISDLIKANEKQQRILDILKKKCVIQLFTDEPWEQLEYKMLVGGNLVIDLTQEEYDLLKEWLKND